MRPKNKKARDKILKNARQLRPGNLYIVEKKPWTWNNRMWKSGPIDNIEKKLGPNDIVLFLRKNMVEKTYEFIHNKKIVVMDLWELPKMYRVS